MAIPSERHKNVRNYQKNDWCKFVEHYTHTIGWFSGDFANKNGMRLLQKKWVFYQCDKDNGVIYIETILS
jgi:hypothetical protein